MTTMSGPCTAICVNCSRRAERPVMQLFVSLERHDAWVAAHARGTGHSIRTVPGWCSPATAWTAAFGAGVERSTGGEQ